MYSMKNTYFGTELHSYFPYLTGDKGVEEVSGELGLQARPLSELWSGRFTHVQEGDRLREVHTLGLAPIASQK
jgi:hypothetical protein